MWCGGMGRGGGGAGIEGGLPGLASTSAGNGSVSVHDYDYDHDCDDDDDGSDSDDGRRAGGPRIELDGLAVAETFLAT